MAKVIAIVGTAVWGYSVIWNKINELDNTWEMSNTKVLCLAIYLLADALEKFAEQAKADLDHLVEMQDAPITSDYQQFEKQFRKGVGSFAKQGGGARWKFPTICLQELALPSQSLHSSLSATSGRLMT